MQGEAEGGGGVSLPGSCCWTPRGLSLGVSEMEKSCCSSALDLEVPTLLPTVWTQKTVPTYHWKSKAGSERDQRPSSPRPATSQRAAFGLLGCSGQARSSHTPGLLSALGSQLQGSFL